MDTKTPSIPLKHQERKEQHPRKQDKSPEPVNLPPLTPLPNGNRQQNPHQRKLKNPSAPWTRAPPCVTRNCDNQKRRPYRVLHIGATPLMHACQQADRSRVLRLLKEQEESIGYRDRTLRSALHYCMDAGTGGAVASAAPELVNAPDAEGHTPLHLAVIAGDAQLVAVLIANAGDVNAKDLEGHSVLHWATVCGEAECVRLVLAAGARPSTPDLRGGSPLHYAAQCCGAAVTAELSVPKKIGLKVLQTLLEFGADVNAKDEDGRQPILWAASAGSVEAVLALARAGGSAAAGATDKDGLTALHCAASRGHARCVEALVNLCGSHPDHVDDNGCSALHYAATLGHADATALLLRLGADPNRQDRKGRTPALCAAAKGQLETLKILAQHGGSLHARTVRGTGIAHEAVLSGRIELIEWLAKKRPSTLDVATHDGKTPLHVAALHGYLDVCKVLLDHGARINAVLRTCKSGPMTALDAALYRGHRDCAKLVQMHGGTTAQHLRTHKTAPNRVFAAKLRVKHGDSSTESDDSSDRRRRLRREPDLYYEERWIERRTRRRTSPRKMRDERRGSRSYSEEEIRLGKTSKRRCDRRARSESSRYDDFSCTKRCERHEYSETTSSETNDEPEKEETKKSHSRAKTEGNREFSEETKKNGNGVVSENDDSATDDSAADAERSLSDDSLEVVVVKKSLEKTSEKVQITGKKLKTPRETSRETRVTETRRSRRKSKTPRSKENDDLHRGSHRKGSKKRVSGELVAEKTSQNGEANDENVGRKIADKKSRKNKFIKDPTDSTSQETVERVTVTALVHKDPPNTPKGTEIRRESASRSEKASKENGEKLATLAPSGRNEMNEIFEKADELQNALMAKDLGIDVAVIRRQMGDSPDGGDDDDDNMALRETEENAMNSEASDEPVTIKRKSKDFTNSGTTSENSQLEHSQLPSQRDGETSTETLGKDYVGKESSDSRRNERVEKKTSQSENDDGATEESEKSFFDDEDGGSKDSGNLSDRAKREISQPSQESFSANEISDKSLDPSSNIHPEDEKMEETIDKIDKMDLQVETWNNREKAFEKLSDDEKLTKNVKEEAIVSPGVKNSKIQGSDTSGKSIDSVKMRFVDGNSSGSAKSRVESLSRPSTGRNRGDRSASPSKRSLFESSEERSLDRSAIVAVIESPEWDEEDDEEIEKEIRDVVGAEDPETEPEDGLGVLRVLPSTSEEETPRIGNKLLRSAKTDSLPRVERRLGVKQEDAESPTNVRGITAGRAKQRRDSGGRDSGIEPSPRVSKIPKRRKKYCPNTEKQQQALNMETVTRDVQISLRRYHLERKIFFQLMELKRLQIRHGRANEHVLVKRQVETFHKAGMTGPTLGVAKYDQPLTFRDFEAFLYEQLRRLQRRPATPDFCTEAKQCTQKTHRCHHATSAYTSVPVYTYLGGGGQEREEGLLPRIESRGRGQMTVEVTSGDEKQVIALPAEILDCTKRYYVTFTVRGEESSSGGIKESRIDSQRNTKSV